MRLYYKTKNEFCCTKLYKVTDKYYSLLTEQSDGFVAVDANRITLETAKEIRRLMAEYNNDIINEQEMLERIGELTKNNKSRG